MATFQKRQYEELADAMRRAQDVVHPVEANIYKAAYRLCAKYLKSTNPNMNLERFYAAANIENSPS